MTGFWFPDLDRTSGVGSGSRCFDVLRQPTRPVAAWTRLGFGLALCPRIGSRPSTFGCGRVADVCGFIGIPECRATQGVSQNRPSKQVLLALRHPFAPPTPGCSVCAAGIAKSVPIKNVRDAEARPCSAGRAGRFGRGRYPSVWAPSGNYDRDVGLWYSEIGTQGRLWARCVLNTGQRDVPVCSRRLGARFSSRALLLYARHGRCLSA